MYKLDTSSNPSTMKEGFQPIAVRSPSRSPWLFKLRCVIDLQLNTIVKFLQPILLQMNGRILDVGAGQSPWQAWLPTTAVYQGIDVGHADEFGMEVARSGIIYYDGTTMPIEDGTYDSVLCIEVLEHSESPQLLLSEMARILRPGGRLILTVPWSARLHHLPYDYHRFTRMRLLKLLEEQGFASILIRERGNDIAVIANKLTVLTIRLLRAPLHEPWSFIWTWPLGVFCAAFSALFIFAAHISLTFELGSKEDPLGYFVDAIKAKNQAFG